MEKEILLKDIRDQFNYFKKKRKGLLRKISKIYRAGRRINSRY